MPGDPPAIEDLAESVHTRADFVAFARELARRAAAPDDGENATLDRFLESLAAWADDLAGYFANRSEPPPAQPSWRLLAQMLLAARAYE